MRVPQRLRSAVHFSVNAGRMVRLLWQAHPLFFTGLVLLTIAQGLLPLASAWVTKLLFDLLGQNLQSGVAVAWPQLLGLLAAQAVLTILQQAVTPFSAYLNAELERRSIVQIESALYSKINHFQGLAYFENPQFYDAIHLAQRNARSAPSSSLRVLLSFVQNVVTLISFLGVLLAFDPLLVGLVLLGSLPQFYTQIKLGWQRYYLTRDLSPQERRQFFYHYILANREAAKEMRLFGLGRYFLEKLLSLYADIHAAKRKQQKREVGWQLGLGVLSSVVATIAFVLVIVSAFAGRLSLGDVTLYVGTVASVQTGLLNLVTAVAGLGENTLFFGDYTNLLALPDTLPVVTDPTPVPKLKSGIEMRHVSFRYGDEYPWVLRDVDLFIPAGQCLALVGLNGAGKTTLVKLLARLYDPTEGQVLWDGIDIREFEPAALRERIGVIFQDFVRYDLTVQENIGLGDAAQLDNLGHVRQAARRAGIHATIEQLPNGYGTQLSFQFSGREAGIDLSGGQWQKLATARLFMRREADLLILDEPTAALDAQAEYETYARFADLMNGRTTFLISHRFSTVRMADKIAILENGRITECGGHDELLTLAGVYAKLYAMQAEKYTI